MEQKTITLFGANGNLGGHFLQQALEAGHKIKGFVRSVAKFRHPQHPNMELIEGDAMNPEDVQKAIADADLVVSCLGSPKHMQIMFKSHDNILSAAAKREHSPRCILISSIGCGGTSWIIKQMLTLIGGKKAFADYEAADKRIREEQIVPFVLVRAYALTDKPGTGVYTATQKQNATFMRPIARADVAKFMLDAVSDRQWDGKLGVQLGGAKA